MPLLNEIFLSLEDTITSKYQKLLADALDDKIRQASLLIEQGQFDAARDIINSLDVTQEIFELDGFAKTKFIQAALFGASQIVEPEESILITEPHRVDILDTTVGQLRQIVSGGIKFAQATALKFIRAEEEGRSDIAVGDGLIKSFGGHSHGKTEIFKGELADLINKGIDGNLKSIANIGANLTTSRVVSYGFLIEAEANGIFSYQVSEVLDDRTCPVCELMHGMIFETERALAKITELLNITDPAQLKTAAPFASQSAQSLAELRELSNDELASRGMDTPPYHPLCRGITVEVGRAVGSVVQDIKPVRPGQVVQTPGGPKIIQPPTAGTPTGPAPPPPIGSSIPGAALGEVGAVSEAALGEIALLTPEIATALTARQLAALSPAARTAAVQARRLFEDVET